MVSLLAQVAVMGTAASAATDPGDPNLVVGVGLLAVALFG